MATVPAGGQFPTKDQGALSRLSASAKGLPEPSTYMVAVATGPTKSAIRGSKPPAEITFPWAFVPPPKPHVWKVTVSEAASVKLASKTLCGLLKVPESER